MSNVSNSENTNGKPSRRFVIEDSEDTTDVNKEWTGMPEFVQDDLRPHRVINVRFRNDEDVAEFEKLIGQTITPKQKAVWFPEMKPRKTAHLIYADES